MRPTKPTIVLAVALCVLLVLAASMEVLGAARHRFRRQKRATRVHVEDEVEGPTGCNPGSPDGGGKCGRAVAGQKFCGTVDDQGTWFDIGDFCGPKSKGWGCCYFKDMQPRPATMQRPRCGGIAGLCADTNEYDCQDGTWDDHACGYVSSTAKCCTSADGLATLIPKVNSAVLKQCWTLESAGMTAGHCISPDFLECFGGQVHPHDHTKTMCPHPGMECCFGGTIKLKKGATFPVGDEVAANDVDTQLPDIYGMADDDAGDGGGSANALADNGAGGSDPNAGTVPS